jgi:hypothetical protein
MGAASAYVAVLEAIERDVDKVLSSNHDIISFKTTRTGFTEPRDFWSTGVIAFANGCRSAPGSEAYFALATERRLLRSFPRRPL